jgi:hypothetical protein
MKTLEVGSLLLKSIAYHRSFRAPIERQPVDGSKVAMTMVDDLATLPGPLIDKVFALYACGVHDYQKKVFNPPQILAMIRYHKPYQPNRTIGRINSNAERSFCYVGPNDKDILLETLCDRVESFDPANQETSGLQEVREDLVTRGVNKTFLPTISDKALTVYFLANEAQLLFALIHPFWERNGRTSEEFLHLICGMNGVNQLAFCANTDERYNPVTKERMRLIDGFTMSLLSRIAEKMGLETEDREFLHVDDLYRAWFEDKGKIDEFDKLDRKRKRMPLKYLHSRVVFSGEPTLMTEYFTAINAIIKKRIEHLDSNQFALVLQDETARTLVAHQLSQGQRLRFEPER